MRRAVPALVSLVLAAVFVVAMAWTTSVAVTAPPGPGGYEISTGWPMVWVTQGVSDTPSLPGEISMGSPWDNPTDVSVLGLALNIFVRWIPIMILVFALLSLRKRPEPTEPDPERTEPDLEGDHGSGPVVPRGAALDPTGGSDVGSTL